MNYLINKKIISFIIFIEILFFLFWKPYLIDDAYVTFRYSLNLFTYGEPLWNVGEMPVEGFSNPILVILLAPFSFIFPIDTIVFWINAFFIIATSLLIYIIVYKEANNSFLALIASILLFIFPSYNISSLMGLETPIFIFFLLYISYLYSIDINKTSSLIRVSIAIFFILTRFEAIIYLFALLSLQIVYNKYYSNNLENFNYLKKEIISIILFIVALFTFRYLYYGEWVTLPAMAKGGGLLLELLHFNFDYIIYEKIIPGILYIYDFLATNVFAVPFIALSILFITKNKTNLLIINFTIIIMLLFLVVLANGGDWMWGHRLITPIIPFLIIFGILLFKNVTIDFKSFISIFITMALIVIINTLHEKKFTEPSVSKYKEHRWNIVGKYLNEILNKNDLIAAEQIGRIAYFAKDIKVLDFHGLVTKEIAQLDVKGNIFGKSCKKGYDLVFSKYPQAIETKNLATLKKAEEYYTNEYSLIIDKSFNWTYLIVHNEVIKRDTFKLPNKYSKVIPLNGAHSYLWKIGRRK